jgi:hypothetical protein
MIISLPLTREQLEVLHEGLEELIGEAEQVLKGEPLLNPEDPIENQAEEYLEQLEIAKERLALLQQMERSVRGILRTLRAKEGDSD